MPVTETDQYYAANLKRLRKKHGLIQYTMAGYLGFTQQQYSDLEKGKKHFSDDIIISICNFFHISILEFLPQVKKDNQPSFLNEREFMELKEAKNNDIKLTVYKKLFLETKIENIETKLKSLYRESKGPGNGQGKYKLHVII